jgi:hypothetical protein
MFKKKYSLLKYFGKRKGKKTLRKRHQQHKRHHKSRKNMRGG